MKGLPPPGPNTRPPGDPPGDSLKVGPSRGLKKRQITGLLTPAAHAARQQAAALPAAQLGAPGDPSGGLAALSEDDLVRAC